MRFRAEALACHSATLHHGNLQGGLIDLGKGRVSFMLTARADWHILSLNMLTEDKQVADTALSTMNCCHHSFPQPSPLLTWHSCRDKGSRTPCTLVQGSPTFRSFSLLPSPLWFSTLNVLSGLHLPPQAEEVME